MKEKGMMSQQHRLIQLSIVGTILLCLFVGVYLFASKRNSKPAAPATIIKHPVDTPPDDALKYWTADKKRKAKATNMPHVDTLDQGKKPPRRPPVQS